MASNAFPRAWCPPRALVRRLLLVLVLPAGGCSADVTRFDFPALATADNGSTRPTGALPTPPEPVWPRNAGYAPHANDGLAAPPRGAGLGDAPPERADTVERRSSFVRGYQHQDDGQTRQGAPGSYALADRPPAGRDQPAPTGETIEVQPGDTLYAIARRHGVPVGALIERNHLPDGMSLRPGQQLVLPAGAGPGRAVAARPVLPPVHQADPPPGWDGQHTLQVGESLYAVARQYRVELSELQRVNGIARLAKVRAGTVLRVPRDAEPAAAPSDAAQGRPGGPPVPARIINQPEEVRTAALGNHATDATAPAAAAGGELGGKFRWPVRGRVIVAFGARPDGTRNDGINIAVPVGTEIHAAEAGRVAYAGSELKGYGNLVLIRHDGGWVSAYAHADQILVKRDDVVRRGQVIARAGKTGSVDQPQLHFELRQGAKPVDPLPHMEPN